jgi:CheY-like chemotaxis protein
LKRLNYNYIVVDNGTKVLEALDRDPYNMVLMDLHMPVMDGFETTTAIIKKYSPENRPIIIAITANNEKDDRDLCLKFGMNDFLPKPVQLESLKAVVEKWLG